MSKLRFMRAEDDPDVIERLREGRSADDIYLIQCPRCGSHSYYNQGSHCGCKACDQDLSDLTDEAITLSDYWNDEPYPCDDPRTK